jgi:hypothetical protein
MEVFKIETCRKVHLTFKNHEITKLDKSLSVCDIEW